MNTSAQFPQTDQFHLKEYESLKREIEALMEHSQKLEIYAVGGLAAFYAWFVKAQPPCIVLVIPTLLAVLGAFRSFATLKRIYEIAEYLLKVEELFAMSNRGLHGWETHRWARIAPRNHKPIMAASPLKSSAAVFWLVLIVISLAAPWLPHVLSNDPTRQQKLTSQPCAVTPAATTGPDTIRL